MPQGPLGLPKYGPIQSTSGLLPWILKGSCTLFTVGWMLSPSAKGLPTILLFGLVWFSVCWLPSSLLLIVENNSAFPQHHLHWAGCHQCTNDQYTPITHNSKLPTRDFISTQGTNKCHKGHRSIFSWVQWHHHLLEVTVLVGTKPLQYNTFCSHLWQHLKKWHHTRATRDLFQGRGWRSFPGMASLGSSWGS